MDKASSTSSDPEKDTSTVRAMKQIQKITLFHLAMDQRICQMALLITAGLISLSLTPFTKVEESFQMQAVHDFLFIGFRRLYRSLYNYLITGSILGNPEACILPLNTSNSIEYSMCKLMAKPPPIQYELWDHEEFPGVVPRTFVGPFLLSLFSLPFSFSDQRKVFIQLLCRIQMLLVVSYAFTRFGDSVAKNFGKYTRSMLIVLTISQFHFLFYASRLLPNTFAMVPTLLGLAYWMDRRFNKLIVVTAFTVIIFRSDAILLFGVIFMYEIFYTRQLSLYQTLLVGIPSGLLAIGITVSFDSLIWGRLTWPEYEGIIFNVFENKSKLWGVEPFYWYFLNVIPRLTMFTFPLVFFASKRLTLKVAPVLFGYIALFSLLPHKELRFVLPAVPLLNTLAANALTVVFMRFELAKKMPESWLWNLIRHWQGEIYVEDQHDIRYQVRERRELAREKEYRRQKELKKQKEKDPTKYDLVGTSSYDPAAADRMLTPTVNRAELRRRAIAAGNREQGRVEQRVTRSKSAKKNMQQQNLGDQEIIPEDLETLFQTILARVSIKILLLFVAFISVLLLNMSVSTYMMFVSSANYPGGEAMMWCAESLQVEFNQTSLKPNQVAVHLDNLVTQTGYTRFLEVPGVRYDKTPEFLSQNKHVITDEKSKKKHSLYVDFSKYKTSYLLFEKVDQAFVRRYCPDSKVASQKDRSVTFERLLCNFDQFNRNCRVLKLVYGYIGIYTTYDHNFLGVRKGPMIYGFRCTNELASTAGPINQSKRRV